MTQAVTLEVARSAKRPKRTVIIRRLSGVLSVAERQGFQSDSKPIRASLAKITAADACGEWLLAQRGTVSKNLDLEF